MCWQGGRGESHTPVLVFPTAPIGVRQSRAPALAPRCHSPAPRNLPLLLLLRGAAAGGARATLKRAKPRRGEAKLLLRGANSPTLVHRRATNLPLRFGGCGDTALAGEVHTRRCPMPACRLRAKSTPIPSVNPCCPDAVCDTVSFQVSARPSAGTAASPAASVAPLREEGLARGDPAPAAADSGAEASTRAVPPPGDAVTDAGAPRSAEARSLLCSRRWNSSVQVPHRDTLRAQGNLTTDVSWLRHLAHLSGDCAGLLLFPARRPPRDAPRIRLALAWNSGASPRMLTGPSRDSSALERRSMRGTDGAGGFAAGAVCTSVT